MESKLDVKAQEENTRKAILRVLGKLKSGSNGVLSNDCTFDEAMTRGIEELANVFKRDVNSEVAFQGLLSCLEHCLRQSFASVGYFEHFVGILGYDTVQFLKAAIPYIYESDMAHGTKHCDALLFSLTLYDVNTGKNRLNEFYAAMPGIRKSLLGSHAKRFLDYYKGQVIDDHALFGLWHFVEAEEGATADDDAAAFELRPTRPPASLADTLRKDTQQLETEAHIKRALKEIMQSVDLDNVTSQDIRRRLSEQMAVELRRYKEFIDHQMLVILGQLDKPSQIFDYLYLGTEWNASNWEELKANGVEYILNVTKEVDNFFPSQFKYLKIWVSDEATTELLMHWHRTYDFVKEAKEKGAKVLVHCKKGISRSASTVVAYAMKEYAWALDAALEHVKRKRDCITPNPGFMEQLGTFHGMLQASNNRHSAVFKTVL